MAVICDKVLKVFFPVKLAVVLFHKGLQAGGKRQEAYVEWKKLLFVAAGLTCIRNGQFDFKVPEFKQPLHNRFSSRLQAYLGGNIMDTTLEILHWTK